MATTGALIGLRIAGVSVDDIGSTSKTLPQFTELWHGMLAGGNATTRRARERGDGGTYGGGDLLGDLLGNIAGGAISNGDILLRGTGRVAGSIVRGVGNLFDGA